ncbi:MAG: PilZ domain-containing protein [Alphaproteobacteria bacterium]
MKPLTIPKREPKRSRVFLSASVEGATGRSDARIRDISRTGALVESAYASAPGEELRLVCGKMSVSARVAWRDRGWFGLEFLNPLTMTSLTDGSGSKLAVSAPRSYHAGELLD